MTQSAKGFKSDSITTVIADTISNISTSISNVASNVSTLTTSVANVQTTITTIATPKISSITYAGDDTAADPAGGQTITLNGLNFVTGATVLINNQAVSVVSVVDSETITFTSPALAAGSYIVYVINTDGGTGIAIPGIQYSGVPAWSTAAGSLGSVYETTSVNQTLSATGDAPVTYSLVSGTLPPGSTLNTNGTISGTSQTTASSTTYTFTIKASDAQNQDTDRQFSITVNPDVVTWSSPSSGASISLDGSAYSSNLSATSAAGQTVSYTANALPTGLTLSSGTISGTPTVEGNVSTLLTATAATTNKSATNTITWVVSLGDLFWKYTTLLLNGSTPTTPFINDASLNNSQLTIQGDTKPNTFNPYQGNGYYGVSHSATPDYLSVPHNANFSIMSGSSDTFIIEGWFYFNAVAAQISLFDKSGVNGTSFANWMVYLNASSQITLTWGVSGTPGTSSIGTVASTTVPVAGTWYHIVFVKSNADWAVFANGTRIITYNGLNTANDGNATALKIGYGIQSASNSAFFNGYISNVRAWRGTTGAPYSATSATLTVPTSPLTAITGTTLLTHQSARFVDLSTSAATVTATGANIKVSPAIPFAANSSYSTYGSAYFDGTGDYLTIASNAGFQFGTNDFTIEIWIWPNDLSTNNTNNFINIGTYLTGILMRTTSAGGVQLYILGTSKIPVQAGLTARAWNHVALVRIGSTCTLYINGAVNYSFSDSTDISPATATVTIGMAAHNSSEFFTGYMSNMRIVKGVGVYSSAFTPATPLTPVANTQLLTLQYNGGANNNGFVDQSSFNNIITRNGNVTQGTFSPYSQNGWSNFFDGTGDYLTTQQVVPLTGNFTIEGWINLSFLATRIDLFAQNLQGSSSEGRLLISITSANAYKIEAFVGGTTGAPGAILSSTAITPGLWYHYAYVRNNNTFSLYINGVREGTQPTGTISIAAQNATIGYNQAQSTYFNGYLSNFRICDTAVYTTNFTPSTVPLTPIIGTRLLTCQSNRLIDNSPNNYTITKAGDVSVQAFSPFGGTSITSNGYSLKFDGTGDRLSFPSSTAFNLGATYTIETWVYLNAFPSEWCRFIMISINGDQAGLCVQVGTTGKIDCGSPSSLGGIVNSNDIDVVPLNTWTHVAICRDGTSARLYINGTLANTNNSPSIQTPSGNAVPLHLGYDTQASVAGQLNGFLSNLRIVKGTALYSSNFTPSTTSLTAIANTSVLVGHTNQLIDGSSNNFAITVTGDTKLRDFNPFGTTVTKNLPYSDVNNIGSVYYDGTGDYLTIPATSQAATVLAGDFTWETWIYPAASMPFTVLYGTWNNSSSQWAFGYNHTGSFSLSARIYIYNGNYGSNECARYSTTQLQLNAWSHIAWVRKSNVIYLYVNGIPQTLASYNAGLTFSDTFTYTTGQLCGIGGTPNYTGTQGYLSNMRYVQGTAIYGAQFVPSYQPATATPSTVFLLNGTSGGIIDYHGSNNLETVGNTQLASEDPYAGIYYSNYFNGTTDGLSYTIPSGGTGNFTVEAWALPTSTSRLWVIGSTNATQSYGITIESGYVNGWWNYMGGPSISGNTPVILGQWVHVALVREGSVIYLYVNGIKQTNTATGVSGAFGNSSSVSIGWWGAGPQYSTGYISNLRVVDGTALYTPTLYPSGFTPSTTPLTAISGTKILTCQSNKFVDNSTNANTITITGTPKVKSMNPFQQNTGKSLYFDGTGDNLYSPPSPSFNFGTKDFTVEFWVYPTASGRQDWVDLNNTGRVLIYHNGTNVSYYANPPNAAVISAGNTTINAWNHIAVSRSSGTSKLFINGVSVGSAADTNDFNFNFAVYVGKDGGGTTYMSGYIKDLRITKYARYTATFTPPTTPMQIK